MLTIGVLALQGAFAKHLEMLKSLNVEAILVKTIEDLEKCQGLIIPGGESTVINKQLDFSKLKEPLIEFASTKPLFGTCAGLILMSKEIVKDYMKPLGFLDVVVERNAFGRQIESFTVDLDVNLSAKKQVIPAVFIRAPRIKAYEDTVEVLASFKEEAVLVKQGFHLGASFHPELTNSNLIHQYFVQLVKKQAN